jgi:hypothetical protein
VRAGGKRYSIDLLPLSINWVDLCLQLGKRLYRVAANYTERSHFVGSASDIATAINLSKNWNLILIRMVTIGTNIASY